MKTYFNQTGAIVTTNDKTLDVSDLIDITDHKDREKIIRNAKHFNIKGKKVVEKTQKEKDDIDEKSRVKPQGNQVVDMLKDIQARLYIVEETLKNKK